MMHADQDRAIAERSSVLFEQQRQQIFQRTDRMFAVLMFLQWIGGIAAVLILSPRTWNGAESSVHPHLWLAISFGGALTALPAFLAFRYPGRTMTRHAIAVTQMLFSSLLIHLSGGRIETHFHVFGSLAFLAFYRDWRVLIPATVVVAADHFVRGVYWPETVFGISAASPWRWIEHAAWVVFEDVFLILSCRYGVQELWNNARRTAQLERVNAEFQQRTEELEQAYRSKNAIVETALDAVIGMDSEGRITGWNSQCEQTFGWTAEEVIGRVLGDVIIPESQRELHRQGLLRFRETGKSAVLNRRIEVTALHRDGREFPVELAVAPIQTESSISFCAFVRDITERLHAAETLRGAKEAAEAANEAKSAFLAHMSHEIRTPLNGILGFADVLLRTPDLGTGEQREYLQTIHDSGRHLLALINDVLDLSKIESGQMDMVAVRCAPHDVIAEVISILRVRAQEKGISLEYTWNGPVPETIVTDPSRFRQLLMNLIGNAVKFTEAGGVHVIARLETSGTSPRLAVDVIDTGIGIAPENLERIFDPFSQADESITRRFGGTGLGLAISRQIAELLGGGVDVQSEPGKGSAFAATIQTGTLDGVRLLKPRMSDLLPRQSAGARSRPQTLPPASILLVEDGGTNRKLISLILRRAGAVVTTAENGRVGLDLALERPFDLVLMDMQMPVLDGYSATTELRRLGFTVPIIALTAHAMKGDEERCRAAGCSGYLTKPIDSDRLLSTVADVLGAKPASCSRPPSESHEESPLVSRLPMDDADFREIVEEFVERLGGKLAEMEAAYQAGDFQELARLAHWLKGAGGTAGFDELTCPATRLERLARAAEEEPLRSALDDLQRLFGRIEMPALQTAEGC